MKLDRDKDRTLALSDRITNLCRCRWDESVTGMKYAELLEEVIQMAEDEAVRRIKHPYR